MKPKLKVITIPKKAKKMRNFFLKLPLSAIAPKIGAINATINDAIELPRPR